MGKLSIIQKKEKWSLTWLGRLFLFIFFLLVVFLYVLRIVPFLSPHHPLHAKVLVVEGYLPDYAMEEAMKIFEEKKYEQLLITGKPRLKGSHLDHFENDGAYSAATLIALGFDSTKLTIVAMHPNIQRDRTYATALAVKEWIKGNRPDIQSFDLVSLGCHSRRSLRLFEMACGDDLDVGIHLVPDQSYNPERWWTNSHGFREVNKESIAWIYARFFFYPTQE